MDVDLPIQTMIILVSETNLWNHWMPFIKKSAEVREILMIAKTLYAS